MLIKHNFQTTVSEGTQSGPGPGRGIVGPFEWNDSHSIQFSSSDLPTITLTGDVTGSGTGGFITTSIIPSGVTAGSYTNTNLTVGADGRITSASNGTASAGFTSAGAGLTASGTTVSLISPVTIAHGGTEQTASPTDGQLLIGDGNTGKFDLGTLSPGNNVTITNGHGTIIISASTASSGFTNAGTGLTASGNTVSLIVPVTVADGGTGQTASFTDGQILIGDSSTGGLDKATLSPGNNITITNGHGSILISASGFTSAGTGLTASGNTVSLITPVTVSLGGTGTASLNAHGILIGEGTASVTASAAMTAGQLIIGQGVTTDPLPQTISGDATVSASGVLTLTASGVTAGSYPGANITVDAKGRLTSASNGIWNPVISLYDRKPDAGEVLADITLAFAAVLPATLTGSAGGINTSLNGATASTTTASFTLYKNGSSIGTASIPAGTTGRGIATFTFASQVTFSGGDSFQFQAPSPQDATLQGFSFSFLGTRS